MSFDLQKIWAAVLGELEITVSGANFATWIKPANLISYEPGFCTLSVPNGFTKARIENKYQPVIERSLSKQLNEKVSISCQIVEANLGAPLPANGLFRPQSTPKGMDGIQKAYQGPAPYVENSCLTLNPRLVFDSFVVGSNNKLAHAAAVAVAETPGEAYNPLFLYGGVGLGKTHLMHAIAQEVTKKHPDKKVVYVTSEKFTNELISSIRTNKTEAFRQKYRPVDVLLIDDVQFIAGKETTQEEFFHTFNAIYDAGHQIVLSSDRPPKAIPTLETRLQSRFLAGLIADVQKPDFETRSAILESKIRQKNLEVPQEVLVYIATNITTNVRELEGALVRVLSHCRVHGLPVTRDIAANVLSILKSSAPPQKTPLSTILRVVADFYHIDVTLVVGQCRKKEYVLPRQVAMFLMRKLGNASLNQIGAEFGGRDHTTVLHACRKIEEQVALDASLKKDLGVVEQMLYN